MQLEVNPFHMGTDKEAALKPLEEAAEVFGAWQVVSDCISAANPCRDCGLEVTSNGGCAYKTDLSLELADCITACCNLAVRHGLDLQSALQSVERRNRERGRYGELDE